MKITKAKNLIIIEDADDFNPEHIFECGQIFSYNKSPNLEYEVVSKNNYAKIIKTQAGYNIQTNNVDYFYEYFDLDTDYGKIKKQLKTIFPQISNAIDFGYGIRILRQDRLESIIGFVLSANNNIKRIQNSMRFIRANLGVKTDGGYIFPTLEKLCSVDEGFFCQAGAGYRAKYLVKILQELKSVDLENFDKDMSTKQVLDKLILLSGVGPKVADCIALFAINRQDVFPVDTWIEKVYNMNFDSTEHNRKIIREKLTQTFAELSGYAQQYLFYYERSFLKK